MKIAKITWLYNGNYGSVLQAVALQKFLKNNRIDVVDLNYNASLTTKLMNWFLNRNSMDLMVGKFKESKMKKSIGDDERFRIRAQRFDEFKKKNLNVTKLCTKNSQIKEISKEYDTFICGSDQIWSPALLNPIFYLSFVDNEKTKISYAPSFGVIKTTDYKKKKISKLLSRFDSISVRETQGQTLVKELIGKDVTVQVDPTMLLNKDDWNEYIEESKIENKKYIFCYLLTPNQKYIDNIKEFADKKGLEVVIVPTIKGPFNTGFKEIPEAGPAEWLNLIKNAEYIFTDSFHGCIFSIIFEKEVFLYKRFSDESKNSENSRVYTLTKWLDIEERLIDEKNMEKIYKVEKINYTKVNKLVSEKAKESKEWLLNAINEGKKNI